MPVLPKHLLPVLTHIFVVCGFDPIFFIPYILTSLCFFSNSTSCPLIFSFIHSFPFSPFLFPFSCPFSSCFLSTLPTFTLSLHPSILFSGCIVILCFLLSIPVLHFCAVFFIPGEPIVQRVAFALIPFSLIFPLPNLTVQNSKLSQVPKRQNNYWTHLCPNKQIYIHTQVHTFTTCLGTYEHHKGSQIFTHVSEHTQKTHTSCLHDPLLVCEPSVHLFQRTNTPDSTEEPLSPFHCSLNSTIESARWRDKLEQKLNAP